MNWSEHSAVSLLCVVHQLSPDCFWQIWLNFIGLLISLDVQRQHWLLSRSGSSGQLFLYLEHTSHQSLLLCFICRIHALPLSLPAWAVTRDFSLRQHSVHLLSSLCILGSHLTGNVSSDKIAGRVSSSHQPIWVIVVNYARTVGSTTMTCQIGLSCVDVLQIRATMTNQLGFNYSDIPNLSKVRVIHDQIACSSAD